MTLALDLFAGARGWSVGAHDLGIHDHGVELMPEARLTAAHAGFVTIHDDVWTVPLYLLPHYLGCITSPPCQTFSPGGKGEGRKALAAVLRLIPHVKNWSRSRLRKVGLRATGDDRTALVLAPLWYALNMPNVRWLAWEQVAPVLPVWEACAEVLREHGWNVWVGALHSEQYGVPQTRGGPRGRAFLIASRDHEVGPPSPTHSRYYSHDPKRLDPGVPKWVSMAEALSWGLTDRPSPTITGGGTETGGAEPIAKLARYTGQASWLNRPTHVVAAGVTGEGRPRSVDVPAPTITGKGTAYWLDDPAAYRPVPAIEGESSADCEWVHDRPSPTIVGSFRPDVVAKPGYRKKGDPPRQKTPGSVRVTVAEAGVLQSFPADYPWQGNSGKQYLQAGNAVPPLLARAVLAEATGIAQRVPAPRLATLDDLLAS